MASEFEGRRTVTTTTRMSRTSRTAEGADQLKANIANIASEIAKVRDQARAEAGALDKIRSMLDVGYLNDLLKSVELLEERIETLESDSLNATTQVSRVQADLDLERSRLEKLWAAYKAQEDELNRVKRDNPLLEEKLFERERTIDSLRKELARLEGSSKYKVQAEELQEENRLLHKDIDQMDGELKRALEALRNLEAEAESLRELGPARERAIELEHALEEERERLAKLYKVYEELETEKKDKERLLAEWTAWMRKNGPHMEAMCQAVGDAPR